MCYGLVVEAAGAAPAAAGAAGRGRGIERGSALAPAGRDREHGELLLQLLTMAGRALGLGRTVYDGFELLAAIFAEVFENRHKAVVGS